MRDIHYPVIYPECILTILQTIKARVAVIIVIISAGYRGWCEVAEAA